MRFPALAPRSFSEVGRTLFSSLLFVACYLLLFLVFARPALAQTTEPIPLNLHNYTQQVLLDLSSGLVCQLVGIDPSGPDPATGEPKKCLGYDLTGKLGFIENPVPNSTGQVGGAIGVMGNLIGVLYTPPASSGDYFRYLADNFGLVKPAYAQTGIGFPGLIPLLPVWTIFRNIAYLIFILVFVVIGLAIMLRIRIDPRTVMTIQNQIPKMIIALVLITFSYAIAGFLIDMMYVMIYLIFNIFAPVIQDPKFNKDLVDITNSLQGKQTLEFANTVLPGGIFGVILGVAGSVKDVLFDLLSAVPWVNGVISSFAVPAVALWISSMVGSSIQFPFAGAVGGIMSGAALGGILIATGGIIGAISSLIVFLIVTIAIFWALFRLWFQLIGAYIFILLDVTFGPLLIATGALPGGGKGISAWIRDILANTSVFPTAIAMFLLGRVFMEGFSKTPGFAPPLIGNFSNPNILGSFIGLGMILMTPTVVQMVREAFKAPEFKYVAAIGQALGAGGGVIGAAPSYGGRVLTQSIAYGLSTKIGHWLPFGRRGGTPGG